MISNSVGQAIGYRCLRPLRVSACAPDIAAFSRARPNPGFEEIQPTSSGSILTSKLPFTSLCRRSRLRLLGGNMLPSSVRRVVSSAVSSTPQTGFVSALASTAPKSAPIIVRGHQRRCSSSKPSRSDNGSNEISAGQSVPASSTSTRADGKAGSDKRKRKSKDASERASAFKKLPSVPSTHHMSQEGQFSGFCVLSAVLTSSSPWPFKFLLFASTYLDYSDDAPNSHR